jgi:hypothetical protein
MERLMADGRLVNPPVVARWGDRYVVLDGATRFAALRRLGFSSIIAQVVGAAGADFACHTWYHAISSIRPMAELHDLLAQVEGLELRTVGRDQLPSIFDDPAVLCYFEDRSGELKEARAIQGAERLRVMVEMVDSYSRWGSVERTLQTDLHRLAGQFPQLAALVVYRQFVPDSVFDAAVNGRCLPAGLTRFVIPGRILRLNADLARLKQDEPLAAKRAWLNQVLRDKLARSRMRYYHEPVVLLDE